MFLNKIHLTNFLSYGPDSEPLTLKPLNILIGPNGSGKSNLIAAVGLLQASPRTLSSPTREAAGSVHDWLWKGMRSPIATIDAILTNPISRGHVPLRHVISFTEVAQRFELVEERIENESAYPNERFPYFYYRFSNNRSILKFAGKPKRLKMEDIDPANSILFQRKDRDQYPEITHLGERYGKIRLYREWTFGRAFAPRQPQKTDERSDFLEEDCANLAMVLNKLKSDVAVKRRILECLNDLYGDIEDFNLRIEGGTAQIFLQEGSRTIPATRLSDGTLRYLALLAILCHPEPPPLICIEEPELGLHPDAVVTLGQLLLEASQRTQLIITTHSDALIDVMSDTPESIVVCEKHEGQNELQRLNANDLAILREKFSLGQLWRRGEMGGNRW
jgi:predicted ATPase